MSPVRAATIRSLLMASTALAISHGLAFAQEAPPGEAPQDPADTVVVVGSQIRGAEVTAALPVTVVGVEEIDAIGAASGDDLFRSIPQLGDVAFNTTRTIGSLNDARGDTASINLRALGTGNTLVLLNGRRMVNHPGTQAENLVPVVTVNTNSIPVMGVERVEVLLDGASAIYGADAVAGVVNTVLKSDFEGFTAELTYGGEDGVEATELSGAIEFGISSDDDRTNLSLFASYFGRDPIFASERPISYNADLRRRLPAEWAADATASGLFNNTSITSAWGIFDRFTAGNITVNGTAVTNAAGQFHIQPARCPLRTKQRCAATPVAACRTASASDRTSTRRQDAALQRQRRHQRVERRRPLQRLHLLQPRVRRRDGILCRGRHLPRRLDRLSRSRADAWRRADRRSGEQLLQPVRTCRLAQPAAVTNAPAGGLDLVLGSLTGTAAYRPIDAGPRKTEVMNMSTRVLAGLRGEFADWDWESALLYSQADTEDKENRVSNTLFQQALARSTPDAYNPFNGGCVDRFRCRRLHAQPAGGHRLDHGRRLPPQPDLDRLMGLQAVAARPVPRSGPAMSALRSASKRAARRSRTTATRARTARSISTTSSTRPRSPTI